MLNWIAETGDKTLTVHGGKISEPILYIYRQEIIVSFYQVYISTVYRVKISH